MRELQAAAAAALRRERLRTTPLRRLLAEVRTEAELREIAAVRGYKRGWVWHMLRTSAEGIVNSTRERSRPRNCLS